MTVDDQQLRERIATVHAALHGDAHAGTAFDVILTEAYAALDRVAALTKEREWQGAVNKALMEAHENAVRRVVALETALGQACMNLATIRPDPSREDFTVGEMADLYYDALMAGWGGVEGYDPGRKPGGREALSQDGERGDT